MYSRHSVTSHYVFPNWSLKVRSALDVLTIGGVVPKVLIRMADAIKLPDNQRAPGMNIILSAAHGEIVDDASGQISSCQNWVLWQYRISRLITKILVSLILPIPLTVRISALNCVNMCVSGPRNFLPQTGRIPFSSPSVRRKTPSKSGEDVLVKMWESVRLVNTSELLCSSRQ